MFLPEGITSTTMAAKADCIDYMPVDESSQVKLETLSDSATTSENPPNPSESLKISGLKWEREIRIGENRSEKRRQEGIGHTTAPAYAGWD